MTIRARDFENPSSSRFEKKEYCSMKKHRRLLWSLGLSALLGLMAGNAQAGSITLSVDLGGVVIFTATSVGTDQTVSANLIALNAALTAPGSAYQFQSLSSNSNYTGGATGFLQTNAQLNTSGGGTTAATLSIDASQDGFLSPTGVNGYLVSSLAANSSSTTSGTTAFTSDFQGTPSPTLTFTAPGVYSAMTTPMAVGVIPPSYSLSNHFEINLADPTGSSEGITGTATLTAIPEPASIVMMLTSMPVPFVVMGLLRRNRKV